MEKKIFLSEMFFNEDKAAYITILIPKKKFNNYLNLLPMLKNKKQERLCQF